MGCFDPERGMFWSWPMLAWRMFFFPKSRHTSLHLVWKTPMTFQGLNHLGHVPNHNFHGAPCHPWNFLSLESWDQWGMGGAPANTCMIPISTGASFIGNPRVPGVLVRSIRPLAGAPCANLHHSAPQVTPGNRGREDTGCHKQQLWHLGHRIWQWAGLLTSTPASSQT